MRGFMLFPEANYSYSFAFDLLCFRRPQFPNSPPNSQSEITIKTPDKIEQHCTSSVVSIFDFPVIFSFIKYTGYTTLENDGKPVLYVHQYTRMLFNNTGI